MECKAPLQSTPCSDMLLVTGIGPTLLTQLRLAQQAVGAPECFQEDYACVLDPPYLLAVWSWVLLVSTARLAQLYRIENHFHRSADLNAFTSPFSNPELPDPRAAFWNLF